MRHSRAAAKAEGERRRASRLAHSVVRPSAASAAHIRLMLLVPESKLQSSAVQAKRWEWRWPLAQATARDAR
jgi:hypothetical protein